MAMTLRLSDDESEGLRQAAQREGLSMQEVARKAIRSYVEGWEASREDFLKGFVRDNEGLLDRLAT